MSLLLLLRPRNVDVVVPPTEDLPLPPTSNTARHREVPPPVPANFLASTARIYFRATQPQLLLVPTAQGGTVRLAGKQPEWEMLLESRAKKTEVVYRAVRDERDLDELVALAYFLTRDPQ